MNHLKQVLSADSVKSQFKDMLGSRAASFMTSIINAVNANDRLKQADANSIVFAAAQAASLGLPIEQNLGFAYLVPYNNRQKDGSFKSVCQFQLGYKGLIQLCMRTNQYKYIGAKAVYEGQYIVNDSFEGFHFDWAEKTSDKVIGYAANFELLTGFSKTLFMSMDDLSKHGKKYSKTFQKGYGLWNDDFDAMASKTVLKLLLGKFAPMSVDLIHAQKIDQAVINDFEAQEVTYVDNEEEPIDVEALQLRQGKDKLSKILDKTSTSDELDELLLQIGDNDELKEMIETKRNELG